MKTVAFGSRLRRLREKHGVNMRDLAGVCGIDFSLISRYENGQRGLSEEIFWQLRDGIDKVLERKDEETRDRQAITEFLEKGQNDPAAKLALINRFFGDSSFRALYVDEYEKFYAAHPEIPHVTREQAHAIRERANERAAERERLLEALQNARTIEEKDARLAAYEDLFNSVEQSLRHEIEQERKEKEKYKRALEQADND